MGRLTGRMGLEPILPGKRPVTISIMLNFDGDWHSDDDGVGMCKQALTLFSSHFSFRDVSHFKTHSPPKKNTQLKRKRTVTWLTWN